MSVVEIETYIETLRALRAEALLFVDSNDAAALNWKPLNADANTIYQLLTHIAGSEAWWIQQIIGGVDIHRDREAEFTSTGDDVAALKARFAAVASRSEELLRGLAGTDLGAMRESSHDRRPVRWCIVHVIEHLARHVGHIELTSQMYQSRARKVS